MSTTADEIFATSLEQRAEVESLDELQHKRRIKVKEIASLKAKHGAFGIWDALRKQVLEAAKVDARTKLTKDGAKTTEAAIDAEAHNAPEYKRFLATSEQEKVNYILKALDIEELEERIRNRELGLLAFNAEARLGR